MEDNQAEEPKTVLIGIVRKGLDCEMQVSHAFTGLNKAQRISVIEGSIRSLVQLYDYTKVEKELIK